MMDDPLSSPTVGVLGMGAFGARLARGLKAADELQRLLLSARGRYSEQTALQLGCERLPNADLVRQCEVIFLCVRAEQALECVAGLPWQVGQVLASTCATLPLQKVTQACRPAIAVRVLPLPSGGGGSCSMLWPDEARVRLILSMMGRVLSMPDETSFAAGCATACLQAWSHQLAAWTAAWAEKEGLDSETSRALVAAGLECAGIQLREEAEMHFDQVFAAVATPGGLSEAGMRILALNQVQPTWNAALDAALARAQGQ